MLTTPTGAERLRGNAIGVKNWESRKLYTSGGRSVRIIGTPATHGPAHADRGPVTGFIVEFNECASVIYVSGDTVWYDGVGEVARRFRVGVAALFMGAARVPEVGPDYLTMTAGDAIKASRAFSNATIVPLHYEGWAHFTESREQISRAFVGEGIESRVHWMNPGVKTPLTLQ